jgi:hypothetical protein
MKGFNDVILDDVDDSLKRVFVDWSANKLQALRGGRSISAASGRSLRPISAVPDDDDDDFDFGGGGEAKISELYDKLNEVERKTELHERTIAQLQANLETAKATIKELEPIAKRANELSDRNGILSKSLTETNAALAELDVAHNDLLAKHTQLQVMW